MIAVFVSHLVRCRLLWWALGRMTVCAVGQDAPQRFEFQEAQMGVPFRMVLYAVSEETARVAAEAAFARVATLNSILSNYETDSELSEVSYGSGRGQWTQVSPELWIVLERSRELSRLSDGAFDLTVGPLASLWRKARREGRLPEPDRLDRMRERVGWQMMELDAAGRRVLLRRPGMRLDPGGIAKGYAVDEALLTLERHGIRSALVAAAGDLAVSDSPPGATPWKVRLAELEPTDSPQFLSLQNAAVATSGDLFQFLEIDGVRYSHIVDPKTGVGLTEQSLVTVVAEDGLTADSLATTLSVLGPRKGIAFAGQYPDVEARILWKRGDGIEVIETDGFFPGNALDDQ